MRHVLVTTAILLLSFGSQGIAQASRQAASAAEAEIDPGAARLEDRAGASPMRQLISLDLRDRPIGEALKEISRQLGGRLMFDETITGLELRVTLREKEIPAREALERVLRGTGFEVVVPKGSSLAVIKHIAAETAQDTATIRGRVVDAASGDPLPAVLVRIRGTERRSVTDHSGAFALNGLSSGEHVLTFQRLGYETRIVTVSLTARQDTSIIVALTVEPIALNALVTTGSGERRRIEVGNSIVKVNVDSIMAATPVATVSELLEHRVPGLLATTNSGAVGAPTRLRMRGISSIESSNEPIIIVDGVRLANSVTTSINNTLYAGVYGGSKQAGADDLSRRLDDLDPNMIESIEVMKGPAASTMYGSEAANGVIIIKTKRGRAGPPRWSLYADYRQLAQPREYDYPIEQVGYRLDGSGTYGMPCRLTDQYMGNCIPMEGVYRGFNMLEDPRFTPMARGYSRSIGGEVSGGTEDLQYAIGGSYLDQLGTTKMPDVNRVWIENARGQELDEELVRPNARRNVTMNARVSGRLGKTSDFALGAGFSAQDQRVGHNGAAGLLAEPRFPSDTTPIVTGWEQWYGRRQQSVKHIQGNANWNWRPEWWSNAFTLSLTYGWDFSLVDDEYYAPRASCQPLCQGSSDQGILGYVARGRRTDLAQTVHLGTSLRIPVTSWLTTYTRVGGNFDRTKYYDFYGRAENLRAGVKLYAASGNKHISDLGDTRTTAGWYVEEQLNFRQDRLFLTLGLRQDAGSSLGETVKPVYPKVNASWIVSEETFFPFRDQVPLLRLRAAAGTAGVMPATTARLRTYAMANNFVLDDGSPTGFFAELGSPGNPKLDSERSLEYEGGFDLELFDSRLTLDFTYYKKFTWDAIHRGPAAGSAGPSVVRPFLANLGDVENHGFELSTSLRVLEGEALSYGVTANLTSRNNKLVRLGEGVVTFSSLNASGDLYTGNYARLVEGYPLFGRWAYPILGWADADGDGIINPLEVMVGDSLRYVGPSEPRYTAYIANEVGLLNNRVGIHATFAYSSGMTQYNEARKNMAADAAAQQGPKASLRDQACVVAASAWGSRRATDWCFMETFDILRLQDLSISYQVPPSLVQRLGASAATVLLTASNLAYWTNYKGGDPMVNTSPVTGNAVIAGPAFGAPREYGIRFRVYF